MPCRLSCYKLWIKTGRYKNPPISRENSNCLVCFSLEDEQHAISYCLAHHFIRRKYRNVLMKYTTTSDILKPDSDEDMIKIVEYLLEIEKNMQLHYMTL